MRAGLIVGGVLGLGTAVTFGAAVVVATAFPHGTLLPGAGSWSGNGVMVTGGVGLLRPGFAGSAPVVNVAGGSTSIGVAVPPPAVAAPADGSSPTAPDATPETSPSG
jgi:hypothetical protein